MKRLSAISILLILTACAAPITTTPTAAPSSTPVATLDIPNWGSTPTSQKSAMPFLVNCSYVTDLGSGATWNGLTIGGSSVEEVINQLAPVEPEWSTEYGGLSFRRSSLTGWIEVHACFIDNTLSTLNIIGGTELLATENEAGVGSLDLWVAEFGYPDRVTWSTLYHYRSVIWAEKGILAVIGNGSAGTLLEQTSTLNIILFPPIAREELAESWLISSLPSEPRLLREGEGQQLPPDQEVEDPWGIEKKP